MRVHRPKPALSGQAGAVVRPTVRPSRSGRPRRHLPTLLLWLGVTAVAAALPFVFSGGFAISMLCQMAIAIVFALSFNMLLGQGGLLDFSHAVFLGFGGFAAMHMMQEAARGWWVPAPLLPLAGAAGGFLVALAAGFVATKRGDTAFAMITLGLAELFGALVVVFPSIFGGEAGLEGDRTDGPVLLGFTLGSQFHVYLVIAGWAVLCAFLMWRFTKTPLGNLANAVRDNPRRVSFIGYDTARIRFMVFALSGLFAGVAGGLQVLDNEVITTSSLSPDIAGSVLLMTFIGGIGTFWGPVLGAILVTFLQAGLSTITDAWQLYDGILFVSAVLWAPGGLSGIILAHAPLMRARQMATLLPSYAAQLPGLLLACIGLILVAELSYRLQGERDGAPAGRVLGMPAHPHEIWQWTLGAAVFLVGAALLHQTWPNARASWQVAMNSLQT